MGVQAIVLRVWGLGFEVNELGGSVARPSAVCSHVPCAVQNERLAEQGRLKIGILGFGNFGQFLARRMLKHKHTVTAWSRSDYSDIANGMGVKFFRCVARRGRGVNSFCADHPSEALLFPLSRDDPRG